MNTFRVFYLALIGFFASFLGDAVAIGITGFLIPSILMGLGVGVDVFLATLAKYRDQTLSWKTWTIPVVFTHISFPALGYFMFWALSASLPVAQMILGLIGFALVTLFIYEVICESAGTEPVFGISDWIGQKFGFKAEDSRLLITILAVSWDALWSGPAKAAQATSGGWSTSEVLFSFFIAGLVVAVVAEIALFLAYFLRRRNFKNPVSITRFTIFGKYLELSVIGGFGVLSFWHGFSNEANLYSSIVISALVMLAIFIFIKQKLWRQQIREARAVAKG
jgi:hypothetical protein